MVEWSHENTPICKERVRLHLEKLGSRSKNLERSLYAPDPGRIGTGKERILRMIFGISWRHKIADKIGGITVQYMQMFGSSSNDTLKLIDGAGKDAGSQDQNKAEPASVNGKEPERQTVPENDRRDPSQQRETAKEPEHTSKTANCTFSGELVPIDLKRFTRPVPSAWWNVLDF